MIHLFFYTDILFFTFNLMLVLFVLIVLIVGIFLIKRGIQKKLNNIILMGFALLMMITGFMIGFIPVIGFLIREILAVTGFTLFVVFTNITFYKERKKLGTIILAICTLLMINQIIFQLMVDFIYPDDIIIHYTKIALDLPFNLLVFNWMAYASYSAYKHLKGADIAPWIKMRYRLISISSFIMGFHSIPEFFQPFEIPFGNPNNLVSLSVFGAVAIISLSFVIGFGLAWLMPNWFKNYLNRNYHPIEEKILSEEELMELIRNQINNRGSYGNN